MTTARWTWIPLALSGVLGCATERDEPSLDGQFGEEDTGGCVEVERTPLGMDEVAANGVRAQDVADLTLGVHEATLTWSAGGQTPLTLEISGARDAALVEFDAEPGASEIAYYCPPRVEITVDLSLDTEDGAFAEDLTAALWLDQPASTVRWFHRLETVAGTFDPADHVPGTYDHVWATITADFDADGIRGEIEGSGEQSEPDAGVDGTVSVTHLEIATF